MHCLDPSLHVPSSPCYAPFKQADALKTCRAPKQEQYHTSSDEECCCCAALEKPCTECLAVADLHGVQHSHLLSCQGALKACFIGSSWQQTSHRTRRQCKPVGKAFASTA
jgi:hypothetical protein